MSLAPFFEQAKNISGPTKAITAWGGRAGPFGRISSKRRFRQGRGVRLQQFRRVISKGRVQSSEFCGSRLLGRSIWAGLAGFTGTTAPPRRKRCGPDHDRNGEGRTRFRAARISKIARCPAVEKKRMRSIDQSQALIAWTPQPARSDGGGLVRTELVG